MRVDVPRLLDALGIRISRREGPELWAPCPFPDHDDHDPSWSIVSSPQAPNNGFHRCFGCEQGGGPAGLVSAVLDLDKDRARRWIVDRGLELGEQPVPSEVILDVLPISVRPTFRLPPGTFVEPPERWPRAPSEYLASRGFGPREIRRWGLGYGLHGRLAGRVVFPVRDRRGRLASYMARSFDGRAPRYLTPNRKLEKPDDSAMFGEQHWPEDVSSRALVLTEGAINALACEQAGAEFIAALGGSELTLDAPAKLARWGRIIRVSDPDQAGDKLAIATSFLDRWSTLREVCLPPGCDARDLPIDSLRRRIHAAL